MNDNGALVDSNILIYAHDESAGTKYLTAKQIIQDGYEGTRTLAFSTQNLGEFFAIATQKIQKPLAVDDAFDIVRNIAQFRGMRVLTIQPADVLSAIQTHQSTGIHYWDCLIAETAKQNGVYTIITENTRDFSKISGIKAKNPFK